MIIHYGLNTNCTFICNNWSLWFMIILLVLTVIWHKLYIVHLTLTVYTVYTCAGRAISWPAKVRITSTAITEIMLRVLTGPSWMEVTVKVCGIMYNVRTVGAKLWTQCDRVVHHTAYHVPKRSELTHRIPVSTLISYFTWTRHKLFDTCCICLSII